MPALSRHRGVVCCSRCQVIFNPKDTNTFASASLDRSVKVWSLGQPMPNFTLEGHEKGVNCVDYFTGVCVAVVCADWVRVCVLPGCVAGVVEMCVFLAWVKVWASWSGSLWASWGG